MLKKFFIFILLSCSLLAADEEQKFHQLCETYWDFILTEQPETATFVGHTTGHDRWSDDTLENIDRRKKTISGLKEAILTLDAEKLPKNDQLNYELLKHDIVRWDRGNQFPSELMPLNQMWGKHTEIGQTIGLMPKENLKNFQDILARLNAVPQVIDNAIVLLETGLQQGITPPKITLRDVPQQILNLIKDPKESIYLQHFNKIPSSISEEQRALLIEQATVAIQDKVNPALQKLHDYLVNTYIPNARDTIAMSDLPNGKEWYESLVQRMTTTSLTAEEIHQIGWNEINRIQFEMEKIIAEVGFDGTITQFAAYLEADPKFLYADKASLVQHCKQVMQSIDLLLPKLFGKKPLLPCDVLPVPSYSEKSQAGAYYMTSSLKKGRPGYFFINTYDLKEMPTWKTEALILHESLPGHHLQLTLSQELEDVPDFRLWSRYTSFIEGWGLYAESLGSDLGCYQDPYSKFGRLSFELMRAIRLVVDTGMHAFGWTRQQAIDLFVSTGTLREHGAVAEVDRYLVMPGQALAYKIGELKFQELRARAEDALGPDFDICEFHDELLSNGTIPLSVAERHINQWIESKQLAIR